MSKLFDENSNNVIFLNSASFKISHLIQKIKDVLNGKLFEQLANSVNESGIGYISRHYSSWFDSGIDCELLEPGKDWKSGKIKMKIVFEFEPDEPEIDNTDINSPSPNREIPSDSPLDDIRKSINL